MWNEIHTMVTAGDRSRPRSRQVAIGPSELGGTCDRRLAMRLAGVRGSNTRVDPWAAIVGTAIHVSMEEFIKTANERERAAGRPPRWLSERRVNVDRFVSGTSDAFHLPTGTVVDWKSFGAAAAERLETHGPSDSYITQAQLYGKGYVNAGLSVRKVALVFLPRAGRLGDMAYFEWEYDVNVANRAIARMWRIAKQVSEARDRMGTEAVWGEIPSEPSSLCGWCPYFSRWAQKDNPWLCPGKREV